MLLGEKMMFRPVRYKNYLDFIGNVTVIYNAHSDTQVDGRDVYCFVGDEAIPAIYENFDLDGETEYVKCFPDIDVEAVNGIKRILLSTKFLYHDLRGFIHDNSLDAEDVDIFINGEFVCIAHNLM